MDIKIGDIVSLRHYSGRKLFKSLVTDVDNDAICVKIVEEIALLNSHVRDPIVLGFESDDEVYIASCVVLEMDKTENIIKLKTENVEILKNKRLFERIPTSFLANIRIGESQQNHIAIVKNISLTGMLICCKSDFPIYQKIKFSLNIGIKLNLQAIIVRKVKETFNYEYGIKLVFTDVNTPALLKKFLMLLKREQQEFMKNFKVV